MVNKNTSQKAYNTSNSNISNSTGYTLKSYEKFDEALNLINSLGECDIEQSLNTKSSNFLPKTYSSISNEIGNIKTQINRLASGNGPVKLIENYKQGYNDIKNAIIEGYIAEYKFSLENGEIKIGANNLKNLEKNVQEQLKFNFNEILNYMSLRNNNSNPLSQYSNLSEFFKEIDEILNKYSTIISENEGKEINIFKNKIYYETGYQKATDVMPYTYLKPINGNDGTQKPLIVWLHGVGAKNPKKYSESDYNLTHVIEQSTLKKFDAYVISPILTNTSIWHDEDCAQELAKLLDKFILENNVDKNNVIICGGSAGGQGALYMASTIPEYFSQAVILSGYDVKGVDSSKIEIPIKGYIGKSDDPNSIKYMNKLSNQIGDDKITVISGAGHNDLPKLLYNLDSNGNGRSDFIEDLFKNANLQDVTASKIKDVKLNNIIGDLDLSLIEKNIGETKTYSDNIQPKNNSDIAHRGYAPGNVYENSLDAFKNAGQMGFWGCEADVRFDKNGNLVCSHNAVKSGENPPSFEEYLDICKEYGMNAIIDLKYEKGVGPADPNLSPSILKIIEEKGMIDSCILQTNNPVDIPYIRENSSDARIWYLTDVITDKNINLINSNNVECVNILSSENNAYRIKKLTENGTDVCVWNVQSENLKNNILNMGAKYVMSDNVLGITPYQEGENDFNLESNTNKSYNTTLGESTQEINKYQNVNTITSNNNNNNNNTKVNINGTTPISNHLTAPMGVKYDGPSGSETWYDLPMEGVVINMEKLYGYTNLEEKIREDGVKVLSGTTPTGEKFEDLVMVAADVNHMSNPTGTFERGQIVETSLGKGIVVDLCGRSVNERKATGNVHFDLATAWNTEPYQSIVYGKKDAQTLTENIQTQVKDFTETIPNTKTNNDISNKSNTITNNNASNKSNTTTNNAPLKQKVDTEIKNYDTNNNVIIENEDPSQKKQENTIKETKNIFSNIKYLNVLPSMSNGVLGSLEITKNEINCTVLHVGEKEYTAYLRLLIEQGFIIKQNGIYSNGICDVKVEYLNDKVMNIYLKQIG